MLENITKRETKAQDWTREQKETLGRGGHRRVRWAKAECLRGGIILPSLEYLQPGRNVLRAVMGRTGGRFG